MTKTMIVQYRTRPERADENAALIKAVFAQLADEQPDGVAYTALRLDDGVSYLHIVELAGDQNPIPGLVSFAQFQEGIAERCADGPRPSGTTVIGSYRSLSGDLA
jgi:hypothetical protein